MRLTVFIATALACAPALPADLASDAFAILKRNCIACHGGGLKASNLDLTTRGAALAGGERGEALVPNYPDRSRIYQFATHQQNPAMPPGKKLSDADLETLRKWILAGAPWPAGAAQQAAAVGEKTAALRGMEERPITPEERAFWSFKKPVRADVPKTGDHNPVDAFLRAKWNEANLKPSPRADKRVLVRRAYLDLIGLPPTPEETKAFLADTTKDAWPRLIERLLASPHYGERQARYWLDLVRYADSGGYEYDNDRPQAWRYRDWVVRAFNNDMPYDRFVLEQLAGDELDQPTADSMIATGYLRLGPENNLKTEMTRLDELDDVVSTTAQSLLGMTVGCARCHNHKFDPIPQKDYYQMQAVFFSTKPLDYPLATPAELEAHKQANKRVDDKQAPLKKEIADIEKPYRDRMFEEKLSRMSEYMRQAWRTPADQRSPAQRLNARQIEKTPLTEDEVKQALARMTPEDEQKRKTLQARMKGLDKERPAPLAAAMAIGEEGRDPVPSYFLHRGSPSNKGSVMPAGVLSVANWRPFQPIQPPANAKTSYRRRSFAEWVIAKENPLTARVMVNRIWQRHFGEGIVGTPNNFGKKGEAPTHPELLDWLATEFMREGWSAKAMHRLIMNSDAYQMASDDIIVNRKKDPTNRLLWRQGRPRLDIETLRDGMLASAGMLGKKVGGPAVLPYIDPALYQSSSKRTWKGSKDEDSATWRRSLYVFSKRSIRYPLFEAFDQPDMITSCARRNRSVTAPQALLLMNNAAVRMHASHFAGRLRRDAGYDPAAQVKLGFEVALTRAPKEAELREATAFVRASDTGLVDFCQALYNLNEFVFMP
ncbi:MAG: PSD1 domain-containing protein [Bryobacterales bacterium]|nr:PSD1 domain-containing protein [Bryobacterales bacterium]